MDLDKKKEFIKISFVCFTLHNLGRLNTDKSTAIECIKKCTENKKNNNIFYSCISDELLQIKERILK